jgi:hypothetical protein
MKQLVGHEESACAHICCEEQCWYEIPDRDHMNSAHCCEEDVPIQKNYDVKTHFEAPIFL